MWRRWQWLEGREVLPSRGIYEDEWIGLGAALDVRRERGGGVKKWVGLAAGWLLVPRSPGDTRQGHETPRYTVYYVVGCTGQGA